MYSLDLSSNTIQSIPEDYFRNLTSLVELNMLNNKLTSLPPGVFDGLSQLKELRLEYNRITFISPLAMNDLISLETLWISYNSIHETFAATLLSNSKVSQFDLSSNPLSNTLDLWSTTVGFNKLPIANMCVL